MSFKKQDIRIKELVDGTYLTIPVFIFKGQDPTAPKTFIQSSVHGAELQGNAAIFELMKICESQQPLGDICFIPMANPFGMNQKLGAHTFGRFDPVSGDNWNRGYFDAVIMDESKRKFPTQINLEQFCESYHQKSDAEIKQAFRHELKKATDDQFNSLNRFGMSASALTALTLQKIACEYDIVLDLHTGPKAVRYLYVPDFAQESALYFHIPHHLIIPCEFASAMDEATFNPWGKLVWAMKKHNRLLPYFIESFTVELGSEEVLDLKAGTKDALGLLNYLKFKKVFSGNAEQFLKKPHACLIKDYITYYTKDAGLIDYCKQPGETVKKGEVLYRVLNFSKLNEGEKVSKVLQEVKSEHDGVVVFHACSSSLHQGMEVYALMTNLLKD